MAHALVHGIGQHGFWPDSYPLLRTLADLIDLGFHQDDAAPLAERAIALVARDVTAEEAEAARGLCRASPREPISCLLLSRREGRSGRDPPAPHPGRPARRGLRGGAAAQPVPQPADRPDTGEPNGADGPRRRLPLRAQIDAIYGRPRHPWATWPPPRRPFDLLRRLWVYGARSLRLRR